MLPELKPMRYRLQVYLPGESSDPVIIIESAGPFMTFQRGDFIDPRAWDSGKWPGVESLKGKVLSVKKITHHVTELDGFTKHSISIYTGMAENAAEVLA